MCRRGSRKLCQGGSKIVFFPLGIIFYRGERVSVPIFFTGGPMMAPADGVIFQGVRTPAPPLDQRMS